MFHSTRNKEKINSLNAIINGLADDGGLYVSESIPHLQYMDLKCLSYEEIVAKILALYFNEFNLLELQKVVNEAYSTFPRNEKLKIRKVEDNYFLELFHGPTLAFKDMALVIMPRLFKLAKDKLKIKTDYNILTATSGDTGGATLNGFKNISGINIYVLYPYKGISQIQEQQMLSFRSPNAKVIALNGNFDDCQKIVKEFMQENHQKNLSSANSINIARLIPQIAYYYYTYLKLIDNNDILEGERINFTVPTGNFGNIFAAFLAKQMGLPINNLICASNKNNVLTEFFNTGVYNTKRCFYKTNSPSMDIVVSSNLERFIYYACNENTNEVKKIMEQIKENGTYKFNNPFPYIYAYSVSEEQTNLAINQMYYNNKYLIDPHTAVAHHAYMQHRAATKDFNKTVIVSTASPYKFPGSVLKALNIATDDNEWTNLKSLLNINNETSIELLDYPRSLGENYSLLDIKDKLKEWIG